jgi:hypothetical protein
MLKRKIQRFRRYKNSKSDQNCDVFLYYRKLTKNMVACLKSVNDDVKARPNNFWKYASELKKNEHVVTKLKMGKHLITQAHCIVEAFANNFSSILALPPERLIVLPLMF